MRALELGQERLAAFGEGGDGTRGSCEFRSQGAREVAEGDRSFSGVGDHAAAADEFVDGGPAHGREGERADHPPVVDHHHPGRRRRDVGRGKALLVAEICGGAQQDWLAGRSRGEQPLRVVRE